MTEPALTRLARFIADDPLEADTATLETLRNGVIDILGCIYAGVGTGAAVKARAAVSAMGANGSALVIGCDMVTARPQAAFLNAVAGHALDFDDWEIPGNTHPTVVLLPALLAVSDSKVSGQDLARAYLAGFEVIARLGEALNFQHYDAGWHSTATLGTLGAGAACARLLGLNAVETAHALSFAISAASGYTCQFGSNAKAVQAGLAARAGVEAAMLAHAGLTARSHALDHHRGMAALMGGFRPARLQRVLDSLGHGYALTKYGLILKPWPSCGYTHRIMTCALKLQGKVDPAQIGRVDLHLPDFHAAVLPFAQPNDRAEALFSLPFVAAMGLLRGNLTIADIQDEAWRDPQIVSLIARTHVYPFKPANPGLNYSEADPDRLVLSLTGGTTLEETCAYPIGSPQEPMCQSQFWAKFDACTGPTAKTGAVWVQRLRDWPQEPSVLPLFAQQGLI